MELIERLPLDKINFLNEMDYKTFKFYSTNCKNEDERKQKFSNLKFYCQSNIKTKGEVKKCYSYTEVTPNEVGGRLYSGLSIQGLQKDLRGFLLRDVTTDIDMKNAHPVILRYICKLNNIVCPNLSYYIENREKVLEEFGEEGKTEFLKAVNDDKINKTNKNKFFKAFDKECKSLQKTIIELSCYKHIVNTVPISREYNLYGSAINRILCVYENKILQEAIHVCNINNLELCALMFDGCMPYGNHYENVELLQQICEYVNSQFEGLDMVFCYKEHSQKIQIPEDYVVEKEEELVLEKSFETVAEDFELTHCKIVNKSFFIKETNENTIILSRQQIITSYENDIYEKIVDSKEGPKIVTENFINDWLRNNPSQRCYDDIECYPDASKCPDNHFNCWKPFAMEQVKSYTPMPDALKIFRKHILILCGNEQSVAVYFEAWIAQMIQYPAVKSVCPTLISKQGAGKGTLMLLLAKMLGEKKVFETTKPSRDVWGDFNGVMANTFLVNLNELSKKETMESEGCIKALITDPKIAINNKGVNMYPINSFHRFIVTTNKEDPLTTSQDDRRNFIMRSSDELIGNKEYFNKMYALLDDVNVIKTCYEYFKTIPDMDKFKNLELPSTNYQNDMKELNMSPIESWLKDYTLENYYETTVELTSKAIYNLFLEWCKKCGIEYKLTLQAFGVRLKRLDIQGILKGRHTDKGETKIFNFIRLKAHFKLFSIEVIEELDVDTD